MLRDMVTLVHRESFALLDLTQMGGQQLVAAKEQQNSPSKPKKNVPTAGIEPATTRLRVSRSTKLS